MTDDSWRYQFSPKTPTQGLVNIRANTPEEFSGALKAVLSGDILQLIVQVEAAVTAGGHAAPLVAPQQPQAPVSAPQAPQEVYQTTPPPTWAQPPAQQPAPFDFSALNTPQQYAAPPPVLAAEFGYCDCNPPLPRKRIEFSYKPGNKAGKVPGEKGYFFACPKGREDQCGSKDFAR